MSGCVFVIHSVMLKPASETLDLSLQGTGRREGVKIVAKGHAKVRLFLRIETRPRASLAVLMAAVLITHGISPYMVRPAMQEPLDCSAEGNVAAIYPAS
ncbi:hypothetical protein CKO42_18750 [Lamprobacter modestohalophilus]|uniref:Uncharacterized protein n=1 Tax=Lamprobacter modestohalophilus TaxID=1064514 RepID=A0A9X0WBL2_9GAMM|nr:hypothetical protein [Lamprobacter modestohalophilus]